MMTNYDPLCPGCHNLVHSRPVYYRPLLLAARKRLESLYGKVSGKESRSYLFSAAEAQ